MRAVNYGYGDSATYGPIRHHSDPRRFDVDETKTREYAIKERADQYMHDGQRLDDLMSDVCCLEPTAVYRSALIAASHRDAQPLRDLLYKRALVVAERDIEDEAKEQF
ncbi:hypothetical protein ACDA63_07360 [Uliginosibacterium sp. sgz301328]|uniref:hypothetical protein n=1 Tax=Uliginosibacterium sp. sgz301328 TaxID=3243764 RepID=UPI00359E75CB